MRFLIAGFGSIGRRHLRNLLALGETDIVLYRTHQSTLDNQEIQAFPVETDLQHALDRKPDAVIIANPTALHLEVAIPAAKAGCHILFEKPVSHSLERMDELKTALHSGGGEVLVGFQFRFHPGIRKVRDLLAENVIGVPISVRGEWSEYLPDWHPWEDYRKSYSARPDLGGGVVLTLSHPLDYLRWLFGSVNSLWAHTAQIPQLEIPVESTADIFMQYQSGTFGNLHLDYIRRPAAHRFEITGTEGLIRWDNADGAVEVFEANQNRIQKFELPQGFDRNDLFLEELRHFIRVCKHEENSICTLDDGIKTLELALAVHQSGRDGKVQHFNI